MARRGIKKMGAVLIAEECGVEVNNVKVELKS